MCNVMKYLPELQTREQSNKEPLVKNNMEVVKETKGFESGVWDEENKELEGLQTDAKTWVNPHASTSHRVEGCIREASHCPATNSSAITAQGGSF